MTEPEEQQEEIQKERLQAIGEIVKIRIDGDWDESTINAVFDELEKMFGLENEGDKVTEKVEKASRSGRSRSAPSGRRSTRNRLHESGWL